MTSKPATSPASAREAFIASLDARQLRNALAAFASHADISRTIPILACAVLEADGDDVLVSHYGIDMAITFRLECVGRPSGSVAIPIRPLLAFMRGADGERVEFAAGSPDKAASDGRAAVTCGVFEAQFNAMVASDAPRLAPPSGNSEAFRRVSLAEGVLDWLFALTLPFVSSEETRYYLNGVALEFNRGGDGKIRAIATDGHRLGTRQSSLPAQVAELAGSVIVPRMAARALTSLAKGREVDLGLCETRAKFRFGNVTLIAKLIDGTFPDWRRVIPQGPFKTANFDASKLQRFAAASGHISYRRTFGGVGTKISRAEKGIRLNSYSSDYGQISALLEMDVPEDMPEIGVNGAYLAGIAKALGDKRVQVGFTDAGSPMRITAENSPEGEFAIVMPMRV